MSFPGIETLARRRLRGTTVTLSRYERRAFIPPHRHASDQLCVLLEGRYEARWDRRREPCRRGAAVAHPRGVLHEDQLLDRSCRSLRVEWEATSDLPWGSLREARKLELSKLGALAAALGEELELESATSELVVEGLLVALCGVVRRALDGPPEEPPDWVLAARAWVRERYLEKVGLRDAALAVGRPTNRLAEQFRLHFGGSVGEMIRCLRVEHAERLMESSELPMTQIALQAGFCDQAHLGRVFRELRGQSPAAWRRGRRLPRERELTADIRPRPRSVIQDGPRAVN